MYFVASEFGIFLTLVGTVLGCGFFSGKEIIVFFSRFGQWSYLAIFVAFISFFFIFRFLLGVGQKVALKVKNSKTFLILNLCVCVIFSSAMFACIRQCFSTKQIFNIFLIVFIILVCIMILKKGLTIFNKFNKVFVPFMILLFLFLLFSCKNASSVASSSSLPFTSLFYSILYCTLNTANSSVVIASLGQSLSKKQKARVAFFSAFVLMLILFFANFILLQNQDSFDFDMPFLAIFSGWQKVALRFVIFLGASTTLFTLTYNFAISLKDKIKNKYFLFFISVVLPLLLSLLGFSFIVCYLEPIASVLSILLLLSLLFEFYKKT